MAGGLDPAATTARHRTGEGGREKREREKRGLNDSNSNFSQKFLLKHENSEYESCREFKNLQLLFQEKVSSSKGLNVILNFRKL